MRPARKRVAIVIVFISTYLTLYTAMTYIMAMRHIYEDANGGIWWRTTPSGSLFPWPREPGMLQALSRVDELDLFIHRYLVRSWILIGLSIMTWVGAGLYLHKVVKAR